MTSPARQAPPEAPTSLPHALVESALEALRREWRSGFNGRMVTDLALPSVRRLRQLSASTDAVLALEEIETRLGNYRELTTDRRKSELAELADHLKRVGGQLVVESAPGTQFGKMHEAVAPGRRPVDRRPTARSLALDAPVTALPRVGDSVAKKLANLGVKEVGDLLTLAPRRYIDYSRTVGIGSILGFGGAEEVTVSGEIIDIRVVPGRGTPRVTARLADQTGWVRITWFNSYLDKQIRVGDRISVSGRLDHGYGAPSFTSPEWERSDGPALSTGRLTPVYPLTNGLAQKSIRGLTRAALDATRTTVVEFLPANVHAKLGLLPLADAYEHIHYPDTPATLAEAQRRINFDRLLLLQLGLVRRRDARKAHGGIRLRPNPEVIGRFHQQLPYRLTAAQERVLTEIYADLAQDRPMARLLQGDVGSGKTAVAATAALVAIDNGLQVAVMAPTEILAEQHEHNFRGLYLALPEADRPHVALLTGSTPAKRRRELKERLASGDLDLLVGTHALIQDDVEFTRLGLVVIDEQHRFGVRQRAHLASKAGVLLPHVLSMTATPIPRTLNTVLNGDLDVSIIDEAPPGRIPIETHRFGGGDRSEAYMLVRREVGRGHQVFVICPLVEESEQSEMKAVVAEAERLKRDVFPEMRIGTLHGRMSGREKDRTMTTFRDGEYDILVSTSVIEVGIDVPNATVMLVEGADRFGLAQLHQFRGRVGRGGDRSYCLLLADDSSPESEARLDLMVETNDGFVLAEKDLELRGPGDFVGTRQSGLPEMSWIDGNFDTRLLDQARQAAEELLNADPTLERPEHAAIASRVVAFWSTATVDLPLS